MADTLRVLARGNLLVLDVAYAEASGTRGQRAYVGRQSVRAWTLDELPKGCPRHEAHNEFLERGNDKRIPHAAYPSLGSAVEVPANNYYRKQVRIGALWPADEATAKECGARFDPTFGGEYPHLVKAASKRGKDGDN